MHDAMRIQSAPFWVQCKPSSGGGWGGLRRLRDCRSGGSGRRVLGRFWLLRNQHFLLGGCPRRWASRLKFRDNRIGIDRRRGGRGGSVEGGGGGRERAGGSCGSG